MKEQIQYYEFTSLLRTSDFRRFTVREPTTAVTGVVFHGRRTQNGSGERGARRTICRKISTNQPFEVREIDTGVQVQVSAHGHDYCIW